MKKLFKFLRALLIIILMLALLGFGSLAAVFALDRNFPTDIFVMDYALAFDKNESDGTDAAGAKFAKIIDGMRTYTPEEIVSALRAAGFSRAESFHHPGKPWIAVIAEK